MNRETTIAIIRLIVPALCGTLTAFGIDMDANTLLIIFGSIATFATFVWSWWKNNSITKAAQEADEYMRKLKESE